MLQLFLAFFMVFPLIGFAMDGEVQGDQPYPPSVQQLDRIDIYSPRIQDSFLINLAMNYKSFSLYEACLMKDYSSGERFAQKSIAAYSGERVLPENPASWSVAQEHLVDINRGYENLIYVLQHSAADSFPALTAEAQAKFDCWVEQATENFQPAHIEECRTRFESAMRALNEKFDFMFLKNRVEKESTSCKKKTCVKRIIKKVKKEEEQEVVEEDSKDIQILTPVQGCCGENPVTREEFDALKEEVAALHRLIEDLRLQFQNVSVEKTGEATQITVMNETFEIFFDFDSSEIRPEYYDVLTRVAKLAEGGSAMSLVISGHTDTSGTDAYNRTLSERRADSVKSFLIKHGANRDHLTIFSKGEKDLKLQTGDGVPKQANRRVVIDQVPAK
ncbi:MAG: OmpA family protein [Alphaproteobacteria bacterium]|nr:OmpA family protein [Alphaproteobacteria bacterium]